MQSISNDTFGQLIAYLVPGATALYGCSLFSPTLQSWFATTATSAPTLGGFLYLTVAALAAGMVINALRWTVVDTLHGLTRLSLPPMNFAHLGENVEGFRLLIEIHYRHYQFYSNMLVATAVAYLCYRVQLGGLAPLGPWDLGILALEVVFYTTSRDTLRKYYTRGTQLLAGEALPQPLQGRGRPVTHRRRGRPSRSPARNGGRTR